MRERCRLHECRIVLCAICAACLLRGCKAKPSEPPNSPTEVPAATRHGSDAEDPQAEIQTSQPIGVLRVSQEVLLHATLYRAAFDARVGDAAHFILEPISEDFPPDLGVEPAEFRSRVLEQLTDVQPPVAWAPSTWRTHVADVFPGTNERATRLTARIISRDDDQATVTAEIGDRTADSRSSRQTVTATWDGVDWRIERGRATVVW